MCCVQRWLRARRERRRYVSMLIGVRQLQLSARDWLARRHTAATVIQSVIRSWSMRKHLSQMHCSARVIQVAVL